MTKDSPVLVYILHLERPLCHAKHYVGSTSQALIKRLEQHRRNQGALFLQRCNEQGIGYQVVRVIYGTRALERRLKDNKCVPQYCPICRPPKTKYRKLKGQL